MALKAMTNTVRIQGLVMAFEDVFLALTGAVPGHGLRGAPGPAARRRGAGGGGH